MLDDTLVPPRSVRSARLCSTTVVWVCFLLALAVTQPAVLFGQPAAPAGGDDEEIKVFARRLKHQDAGETLAFVELMLSPRGTVELQTAFNLIVVHDIAAAVERIKQAVEEFDHPPRPLRIEILVLGSGDIDGRPPDEAAELPPWLNEGVGNLLRVGPYRSLARARIGVREGQEVEYDVGGGFLMRFEAGTVLWNGRLRLRRFEIRRGPDRARLLYADISLQQDKPYVLGFARNEATGVKLLVALVFSQEEELIEVPSGSGS